MGSLTVNIDYNDRQKYTKWACLLVVALLLILTACSPKFEPPLRVGTNTWPGYEPLYLARDLGYFENTSIKLVEMPSGSEVIHALRSGTLEAAGLTLDETLTVLDEGLDLKVILVMDYSNGADVLLAKPTINSLAELEGKRVGVEYTAVGAILLDGALDAAGLKVEDVELEACTWDEHIECYESVDAIVTFEPAKTTLMNKGAKKLFDSSKIPGRIVDVLVVRKEFLERNTRSLQLMVNSYFKAREYMTNSPDHAAQLIAVRLRLTPDEAMASFDGIILPEYKKNKELLIGSPSQLELQANKLAEFMLQKKLIRNSLLIKGLIDARFLAEEK